MENGLGNLEWLGDGLSAINYWAVIVAALSVMVVGSVWYARSVFGETWRKRLGMTLKQMQNRDGMVSMFLGAQVFALFAAAFLQGIMIATGTEGFWNGFIMGAVFGLVFGAMPMATNNLFSRRHIDLTAIDGGYIVASMAVMGGIVGVWM
jgi:hypothetical protein